MRAPWIDFAIDHLQATADREGGFGYHAGAAASPEPTALGALALSDFNVAPVQVETALTRLAGWQQSNGSVPVTDETPGATWPTALAVLAWGCVNPEGFRTNTDAGVRYLLGNKGKTFQSNPHVYGHDTTLVGWPWIEQTHTWIEPTAYALLALRCTNQMNNPRAQSGLRVIFDRAIPSGGWNYGNAVMFENRLRPFPSTTGIALAALAGQKRDRTVDRAINFLHGELPRIRSCHSLAWGVIGMKSWNAALPDCERWLEASATRDGEGPVSPLECALMLLASTDNSPFSRQSEKLRAESGAQRELSRA